MIEVFRLLWMANIFQCRTLLPSPSQCYFISAVLERKDSFLVEDSGTVPSPKPISASAILTFVPDNEVKKIVTRQQVDNSSSPSTDKQMVLTDRKPAIQDCPYARRRSPVLSDHSKIGGTAESDKEPGEDKKLVTAEGDAKASSSLTDAETGVDKTKEEAHSPKMMSEGGHGRSTEGCKPGGESRKESQIPVASEPTAESGHESKSPVAPDPTSESGKESKTPIVSVPIGESANKSKLPAASVPVGISDIESKISGADKSLMTKGDQVSAKSVNVSKDELPSKMSGDKPIQPTVSSNQAVDAKISASGNKPSTQASSIVNSSTIAKTQGSPSLLTNNSLVKSVAGNRSIAVSSFGALSQPQSNTLDAAKQEVEGPVFRLGQEANYSSYVNQFTSNALALTKQQQLDQRDKKRSVSHKFSLNEFKWHGDTCGNKDVILNTLRFSVVALENSVPTAFMHPLWPVQRSTWVRAVHLSKTPQEFAAALSFLESCVRPICYLPVWNDAVGHVELHRVMSEARQVGIKKKDHKEEEEEPELDQKGFGMYMHAQWRFKDLI